jgi:hypothetical protein
VITLAATILLRRKSYYEAMEAANKQNEITNWLAWFSELRARRSDASSLGDNDPSGALIEANFGGVSLVSLREMARAVRSIPERKDGDGS